MKKVRGVWLTNVASNVYDSNNNIDEAIKLLASIGFNAVFPVVWNKGYTLYQSDVMERYFGSSFRIDPLYQAAGRDPLDEIIQAARKYQLKVIPWFEYGFAASAVQKTVTGGLQEFGEHILQGQPNFAAVNHDGEPLIKPFPEDVNDIGFKWMNALSPDVQVFMTELMLEVVQKYDVDGIQGDDRLPAFPVEGFDQDAADQFKTKHHRFPTGAKDGKWMQFRADILTQFLKDLCVQVRQIGLDKGKTLLISMAPHPRDFGFREYLQDTPKWLDLIDMMHPQLYRRTPDDYITLSGLEFQGLSANQITKISPGILMKEGNYRISNTHLEKVVRYNRSQGCAGEVFFFFEGLRKPDDLAAKFLRDPLYAVIKRNDEGPDVLKIQKLLIAKGFNPGEPDGFFGEKTEMAVRTFQAANFSSSRYIDGKVGKQTLEKLGFTSIQLFGDNLAIIESGVVV
jgi:uncharacterized lipoprotein YddW (UPF0748 family)